MSGIIRVKKDARYFVASNEPFNDKDLSWEARGVMGYLLSKPDNWITRTQDLVRRGPAGEHKVTRILGELKRAGYVRRERRRNKDGRFEWETVVYESRTIPQLSTNGLSSSGSSTNGLSTNGKLPHIEKTDLPITESPNTERESTEGGTAPTTLSLSALEIYQSVTKIKKADKIPEVVTDWLQEQERYMSTLYHPEALRQAIKDADKEGQVFSVEVLEVCFLDNIPHVVNVNFATGNGKKRGYTINRIDLSNGDKLAPKEAPTWLIEQASGMVERHLEEQAQQGESRADKPV